MCPILAGFLRFPKIEYVVIRLWISCDFMIRRSSFLQYVEKKTLKFYYVKMSSLCNFDFTSEGNVSKCAILQHVRPTTHEKVHVGLECRTQGSSDTGGRLLVNHSSWTAFSLKHERLRRSPRKEYLLNRRKQKRDDHNDVLSTNFVHQARGFDAWMQDSHKGRLTAFWPNIKWRTADYGLSLHSFPLSLVRHRDTVAV